MMFTPTKECSGVYHDKNYRMVSCCDGHITFSYAAKGKAMTMHFASDRIGLRQIKPFIEDFCKWLFKTYDCPMIFGVISKGKPSIARLASKMGFIYLTDDSKHNIYVRTR